MLSARRSEPRAARASPSASSTAPPACAASALSSSLACVSEIASSSPEARRAFSRSPAASMISTKAGNSPARLRGVLRLFRHARDRGRGGLAVRPGPTARAPSPVAARSRAGRRRDTPPRRPRAPLAGAGFPPAGRGRCPRALVQHTVAEALTGSLHLFQGGLPGPLELHDLGAMDQADAGVSDHVGLAITPLGEGSRPLARAAHLVRVLTELDRVAVDDAGDDRRQLARRDGHHGLVHQPEALLRPTLPHQGVALPHPRHRDEVRVVVALADCGSLRPRCVRRAGVTGLEPDRYQEIAVLDAVTTLPVEQAVAAAEPAVRTGALPAKEQVVPDPPGAARGAGDLAGIQMAVMGTLEAADVLVVATEHVRRPGQQLQVLRLEEIVLVRPRQRFEGVQPGALRVRRAAAFEHVADGHLVHSRSCTDPTACPEASWPTAGTVQPEP